MNVEQLDFMNIRLRIMSLIHDLELENDIIQLPKDIDYILRGKKTLKRCIKPIII